MPKPKVKKDVAPCNRTRARSHRQQCRDCEQRHPQPSECSVFKCVMHEGQKSRKLENKIYFSRYGASIRYLLTQVQQPQTAYQSVHANRIFVLWLSCHLFTNPARRILFAQTMLVTDKIVNQRIRETVVVKQHIFNT